MNNYCNLVGSNHIKDEYGKISQGFDLVAEDIGELETLIELIGTVGEAGEIGTYSLLSSGEDAYTATFAGLTLFAGLKINLTIRTLNTGAATLNINGLGAKGIKIKSPINVKTDVVAGALTPGFIAQLQYDGTDFILINGTNAQAVYNELLPMIQGIEVNVSAGYSYRTKDW